MASYSSSDSSKQHSPSVFDELKKAKRTITLNDEAIRRMEKRLEKLELKHERSSHSIHGRHHSPRHSSKDSSNAHG